jgi:hypothetical protein
MYDIYITIYKRYKIVRPKIDVFLLLVKNSFICYFKKILEFVKKNFSAILYGMSIIVFIFGISLGLELLHDMKKLDGKVLVEKAPYSKVQRIIVEQVDINYTEIEYQITFLSAMGDSYYTTRLSQKDLDYLFKQTRRAK